MTYFVEGSSPFKIFFLNFDSSFAQKACKSATSPEVKYISSGSEAVLKMSVIPYRKNQMKTLLNM